MTSIEYKGYVGVIEVDAERKMLHGTIVNTRDVITFEGRDVAEIEQALEDSIEDYLEFCGTNHREPEKPASGRFVVRIDPAAHRELMRAAARADKSLNSLVREAIAQYLMGDVRSGADRRRPEYQSFSGRSAVAEPTLRRSQLGDRKRKTTPARDTVSRKRRS